MLDKKLNFKEMKTKEPELLLAMKKLTETCWEYQKTYNNFTMDDSKLIEVCKMINKLNSETMKIIWNSRP